MVDIHQVWPYFAMLSLALAAQPWFLAAHLSRRQRARIRIGKRIANRLVATSNTRVALPATT
ncbi:hypothetical protein [Lysobacter sp. Hz 25]|uniref:hypothetical protein n=1 Tax=Lysobacter sp. Hz 25 TaxID=3383698 RepID=UPI0038D3C067